MIISERNKELEDEVSRLEAENAAFQQFSSSMSKLTYEFNICSYELDQSRKTIETNFDRMNWNYYHNKFYSKFLVNSSY